MNTKRLINKINQDLREEGIESWELDLDMIDEVIIDMWEEIRLVVENVINIDEREIIEFIAVLEENFLEEYVLAIYSSLFYETWTTFLKYFKKVITRTSLALEKRIRKELVCFLENKGIPKSFIDKYSWVYAKMIKEELLKTKEDDRGIFIEMLVRKITTIYRHNNRSNKNKYDKLRFKKARENLLTLFYQYGGDISYTWLIRILSKLLK